MDADEPPRSTDGNADDEFVIPGGNRLQQLWDYHHQQYHHPKHGGQFVCRDWLPEEPRWPAPKYVRFFITLTFDAATGRRTGIAQRVYGTGDVAINCSEYNDRWREIQRRLGDPLL